MPSVLDQVYGTTTAVKPTVLDEVYGVKPRRSVLDEVYATAAQPAHGAEDLLVDKGSGISFHKQRDGRWSSVRTETMTTTEGAVNFPTVMPGGNILEGGEALHYWQTIDPDKIEHFPTLDDALQAAEEKHIEHERIFGNLLHFRDARAHLANRRKEIKKARKTRVADTIDKGELEFTPKQLADPNSQLNNEAMALKYGITPEEAARFRKMEPIGVWEKMGKAEATDVGERLPIFAPLFTMKRARLLRNWASVLKDDHADLEADQSRINEMVRKKRPIWPEAEKAGIKPTLGEALHFHLDRYNRTMAEMQKTDAAKGIAAHLRLQAEYDIRGQNWWAKVGGGVSILPKYMIEFLLTGGFYHAGKTLVMKSLEHKVKSTLARLSIQALAAAAGTTLRTVALSGNVISGADARIVPTVRRGLDGRFYIRDSDRHTGTELFRSLVDQWIENYTEVSGVAFGKAMARVAPKMYSALRKMQGSGALTAVGFHGFVEELSEEQLGRFMRWGVGLTGLEMGVDSPFATWEQLGVEMGVLGVPTLLGMAGRGISSRLGRGPAPVRTEDSGPTPQSEVDEFITDMQRAEQQEYVPEEIDLSPPVEATELTEAEEAAETHPEGWVSIDQNRYHSDVTSPEQMVTVHRGLKGHVENAELREGDWVTRDKHKAETYAGEGGTLITQEVRADSLWVRPTQHKSKFRYYPGEAVEAKEATQQPSEAKPSQPAVPESAEGALSRQIAAVEQLTGEALFEEAERRGVMDPALNSTQLVRAVAEDRLQPTEPSQPAATEAQEQPTEPKPEKSVADMTGDELIAAIEADKKQPSGALQKTPEQYAEMLTETSDDALKALRTWAKGDNYYVRKFLDPVIVAEARRRNAEKRKAEADKRTKKVAQKKKAEAEKAPARKKARRQQNAERKRLEQEIVSQWESESGESIDALEMIEEQAEEQAGANFTFGGKLPAEITDHFPKGKNGKPIIPPWARRIFRENAKEPGEAGGEEMLSRLGGEEMIRRARAIFEGRRGRTRAGIEAAERWAREGKDIEDTALLLKIERWRAIEAEREGEAETQSEVVKVSDLKAGDTFEHLGEKYTVQREEGGAVIIRNGHKGHLFDGDTIPIDKGTLVKAKAERRSFFEKSKVDAARERFWGKMRSMGANKFLDPGLYRDLGIIIIDYVDRGVRKLGDIIAHVQKERGLDPNSKSGKFIAGAVRKAWRKPEIKKAVARVQVIKKAAAKAQTAAQRRAVVKARIIAEHEFHQGETIRIKASKLIAQVLRHESRGARIGYRAGAKDIVAKHVDLAKWAENEMQGLPLSTADYGKLMYNVAKARTTAERIRAIAAIEAVVERGKRNKIIQSLTVGERIRGGGGKMVAVLSPQQKFNRYRKQEGFEIAKELENVFNVFKKTARAGDVAAAVRAVLTRLHSLGRSVSQDSAVWKTLSLLDNEPKVTMNRLETGLLVDTVNAISDLVHTEAHRFDLMAEQKYRNAQQQIAEATNTAQARAKKLGAKRGRDQRVIPVWTHITRFLGRTAGTNRDYLVEYIVGQDGVGREILHTRLNDAEAAELDFHDMRKSFFVASLAKQGIDPAKLNLAKWRDAEVDIVIGGEMVTISQGELAGLIANLRDTRTRELLFKEGHEGIEFSRDTSVQHKLTEADVPGITSAASKETLAIVKAIMDWINGPQREMLNDASQHLIGRDLATRYNMFPRRLDPAFFEQEPDRLIRQWQGRMAEHAGQLKHREGSTAPMIIDDVITTFERHSKVAGVYITKQAATHDAMRLLQNKDFRKTIEGQFKDGKDLWGRLVQHVRDFHGLDKQTMAAEDRLVRFFFRNFHVYALGLKPHIALYQTISYVSAVTDMPLKYLLHKPVMPTQAKKAEISRWSPTIAARFESSAYSLMSQADIGSTERLGQEQGAYGKMQDISLSGIRWMDHFAIVNIWEAAMKEGRAKGHKGKALNQYAARRTEFIVEQTQPTWGVGTATGLAMKARRNPWIKPLALFSSQTSKYFIRARKAILRYRMGEIGAKRMLRDVAVVTVLQATMIYALQRMAYWAYSGFQPSGDDEKGLWADATKHGFGVTRRIFGQWLVVREGADMVINATETLATGKQRYRYSDGPLTEWRKTGQRTMDEAAKFVHHAKTGDKFKSGKNKGKPKSEVALWRAIREGFDFISVGAGVPSQGPLMIYRRAARENKKKAPAPKRIRLTRGSGARRRTARQ